MLEPGPVWPPRCLGNVDIHECRPPTSRLTSTVWRAVVQVVLHRAGQPPPLTWRSKLLTEEGADASAARHPSTYSLRAIRSRSECRATRRLARMSSPAPPPTAGSPSAR